MAADDVLYTLYITVYHCNQYGWQEVYMENQPINPHNDFVVVVIDGLPDSERGSESYSTELLETMFVPGVYLKPGI